MNRIFTFLFFCFIFLSGFNEVSGQVNHLVISQVYGGGGNTSATYTHDFIEVFNPTGGTINITGYSVQYTGATGTTWNSTNLTGTIGPGQYYLVQQSPGAGGTTPLPTPDAIGSASMAATAGKVALVSGTTTLTGSCPTGVTIIDFVGYGTTADCREGGATTAFNAPAPSNTNAIFRKNNGCTDTDNNNADFITGTPNPRNTSSSRYYCFPPPSVSISPATGVTTNTATLNGTVNPNGATTTVTFEWGPTTSYGNTATATQSPVSGTSSTTVSVTISNLLPGTQYYYRILATNAAGTTTSSQETFTTASQPTATISGNQTICSGGTATLTFGLTGTGTISVTYSNGATGGTVTGTNGQTVTATITNVPAGTYTYTITGVQDANGPGTGTGTATVVATPCTDLSITKSVNGEPLYPSRFETYSIKIRNLGGATADNVEMNDAIPAGTVFVSLTAPAGWTVTTPPVGGTGTVSATKPTLTVAEGEQSFILTVKTTPTVAPGTVISNTATVSSTTTDSNMSNNSSTATKKVMASPPCNCE